MDEEQVKQNYNYCLSCKPKPCKAGCPLENDITDFIKLMKEQNFKSAFEKLCETTVLMPICGRICPHEKQCQGSCIRRFKGPAVQIGMLEAYIGDLALKNGWELPTPTEEKKFKVAVVGSGPAGLTCAHFLRRQGYKVTIYEKYGHLGGILHHGIPNFRLDKVLLKSWIDKILKCGIKVETNKILGKDIELRQLKKDYDAVFLGFGANLSSKMNIPGEDLLGVYGGNEFLENDIKLDYFGKTVVVSGGGNVAMDVARTTKRQGAKKVIVVYRRSEKEMPADTKEILDAKADGVEFMFQTNILKVLGTKNVSGIECIKTELVQRAGENRLSPVNVDGSNFNLDCDYVMMAIGSRAEKEVVNTLDLDKNKYGGIAINEAGRTSDEKVFSGGDIAGNKATVAWAARAGRNAAYSIIDYLEGITKT